MAIATLYLTGFEHGLASALGGGLLNAIANGSVVTTSPRNGSYCGRVSPGASAAGYLEKSIGGGTETKIVARFGALVSTRPSSGTRQLCMMGVAGLDGVQLEVDSSGVLSLQVNVGTVITGPTLPLDTWARVEIQADCVAGTADWKVDGVSQTQATGATATNFDAFRLGDVNAVGQAFTARFDDWIFGSWSSAASDWYGDGRVLSVLPASDGTHSIAGNQFSFGDAGTAFSSTSTAYTMVDDAAPWTTTRSTTDNLGQRITGTANYLEINPATLAAASVRANAVRAMLAYSASTTTVCVGGCIIRNSGNVETEIWGTQAVRQNYNVTSNNFKGAVVAVPAAGWTPAEIGALRWRCGYSADISPVPTWQALMLEVDWPTARPVSRARQSVAPAMPTSPGAYF